MKSDIITAIAAIIAAMTGIFNYHKLKSEGRDKIKVSLWDEYFDLDDEEKLHVVNLKNHKTVISDWGFLLASGHFSSIPVKNTLEAPYPNNDTTRGNRVLEGKSSIFVYGTRDAADNIVGAYAKTATQKYPRFCILPILPLHKRIYFIALTLKAMAVYFLTGRIMYRGQ